jgi:hypothetical protein
VSTQTHANAGASGQFRPADLVVPTTRMLAIGRLTEAGKSEARFPIMPSEVRETIRLHLSRERLTSGSSRQKAVGSSSS